MISDNLSFKEQLDYLKGAVDPVYLLNALGIEVCSENANEFRGVCVAHNGSNTSSFRFNKQTNTWICFSSRCHEIFGKDVIGLIRSVLSMSFMDAVKYLQQLVGDIGSNAFIDFKRQREMDEFIYASKKVVVSPKIVNESSLNQFKPFRSTYFADKGFSKETLDYFEIAGGYTDKHGNVRDIIPIRDADKHLVGYSLRDIIDREDDAYKYIFTENCDRENTLYNLHNIAVILPEAPLIVVEGYKSVWRLYEYGIKNVVASMGTYISPGQISLLYRYALKGVVLFFDGDNAGVTCASKLYERLNHNMDITPIFITETNDVGKGLDPSDLSKQLVCSYLGGYIYGG